jgi:Zn-dependent protease
MGNAFVLGRLFGIQFRVHYTWFIIFILITGSLSWQFFPDSFPGWSWWQYWVVGAATSLIFFASVVAHELAHSLVGRTGGITIKSITLFIFGGVAHMSGEANRPGAELKMAVAGPVCSLVIGGLFGLVWFLNRGANIYVAAMFGWLALVNLSLAVFNLIPGFPLDGGRVFRSLLWRFSGKYLPSTRIATWLGRIVGYLFVLGGLLSTVFLHDWLSGIWLVLIGWFLENAASESYQQAKLRNDLQGFSASQVMTSDYALVPADIRINQLVQELIFAGGRDYFLVMNEGKLTGILTLDDIKAIPQRHWPDIQVKDVMTEVDEIRLARPEQNALSIMEQMDEDDLDRMPVADDGRVVGAVSRDNLARFLRVRSELKL